MKDYMLKFLKILAVELEDIEDDIKTMEELYEFRYQKKEITEYVHLENQAQLQREYSGIKKLCTFVKETESNVGDFKNIDELILYLNNQFHMKINAAGYPDAIFNFIGRKITKVKNYII